MLKKKTSQRKGSTSSSAGSNSDQIENDGTENNVSVVSLSNDASPTTENDITKELPRDEEPAPTIVLGESKLDFNIPMEGHREQLCNNIHFFSDGELGTGMSPHQSLLQLPIQSDTEFEVSQREKSNNVITSSASWKWGEPIIHQETYITIEIQ
jgi:hypothetical protein